MILNNSIMDYPNRGKWGNSKWRGNCSGHVIYDLLETFKPKRFVEVFSGGGTGEDVAKDLGYTNSLHLDLVNGWNALKDEIPKSSDFVFSHPPYFDIINYNSQRGDFNSNDLSNKMPYPDFIKELDTVNEKIYNSLVKGGRHAILIGDVRKKGKFYSIIKDMTWFGDLEQHIIKIQHNTFTQNKIYNTRTPFIAIAHEHLLIFKKNEIWTLNIKYTKNFEMNIKQLEKITWRDLVRSVFEEKGKELYLKEVYEVLDGCKKSANNQHWKEKIRQTINTSQDFIKIEPGRYKLAY
jgi:predicted nucleic-acid-binding Zn-ribbon protein